MVLEGRTFCVCTWILTTLVKVNSVQEACIKCFAVHLLKYEILQITWKKWNNEHQTPSFQFFTNRSNVCFEKKNTKHSSNTQTLFSILIFFVLFFYVVCKISNFNMWTAKHLMQAFCTELTLQIFLKAHLFIS